MDDQRIKIRTLVVFASEQEAKPFLKQVDACLLDPEPYALYEFAVPDQDEKGLVMISGIGKIAAEVAVRYAFVRYKPHTVVNAGLVGVLLDDSLVGELVQVDSVVDYNIGELDQDDRVLAVHEGPWNDVMPLSLMTLDKPLVDPSLRDSLVHRAHVVDMEGFGIAHACVEFDTPCMMLKAVSDRCDAETNQEFFKRLPALAKKISERLVQSLDQL